MIDQAAIPDDESPLTPEEMLALSAQQSVNIELESTAPIAGMYLVWGIAWMLGYLLHWSNTGGNPWFTVDTQVTIIGFSALILTGAGYSIISGARIHRGLRGKSKLAGTIYGLSWAILSTAIALIGVALIKAGMSSDLAAIYFPCAFTFMVGSMYLFGAALPFMFLGFSIGYSMSAKAAVAVIQVLMFGLAFAGGLFLPPQLFPDWLEVATRFIPTRQAREFVIWAVQGGTLEPWIWLGLIAWTVVLLGLSLILMRRDEGRRYA